MNIWEKVFYVNENKEKSGVAIVFISDKIDFKTDYNKKQTL